VNVRAIDPEDAERVASVFRADEEALRGRPSHLDAGDVRAYWARVDFERDSWLFEEDGDVLGAGWYRPWGETGHGVGGVAQGAKGRGIRASLAERYGARAHASGVERLRTFLLQEDAAAAALFAARGFQEVRRFYEMAIDLDAPPPEPVVPPGLVLEPFREEDARGFHAAVGDAFSENWDFVGLPFEEWWSMRRGEHADEHGSLWFVVRDGDEIAAAIRNEAHRGGGGFVGLLGVRRPWRGRGLGRALLHRSFCEFWRRGLTRVTLGVDSENPTGATRLYESVGMSVESTNVTYEKALA
jgi:mycothiol synthase